MPHSVYLQIFLPGLPPRRPKFLYGWLPQNVRFFALFILILCQGVLVLE